MISAPFANVLSQLVDDFILLRAGRQVLKQRRFAANDTANTAASALGGPNEAHGWATFIHELGATAGEKLIMLVRLLESLADHYAVNKICHSAKLRLQFPHDCRFVAEDIYHFYRNPLVAADRERV